MLKLRLMMEDVAEKLFGRLLPQVEAQASCNCSSQPWVPDGCCPGGAQQYLYRICKDSNNHSCGFEDMCTGICMA
jgi:hypothetical protein